jgi:hypothetical protein
MWLSNDQWGFLPLSLLFVAIYLVAMLAGNSKNLIIMFSANLLAQLYCLSPLYNYALAEFHISFSFFVYGAIYIATLIYFIWCHQVKAMIACSLMIAFEITSWGVFYNDLNYYGVQEVIRGYYEFAVTFLHLLCIVLVVKWGDLCSYAGRVCHLISRSFLGFYHILLYRGQARYNKNKINTGQVSK